MQRAKAVQIDNNAEVDSTISDINYEEIISAMTLERERKGSMKMTAAPPIICPPARRCNSISIFVAAVNPPDEKI
jgi:hypothetical protein